jgi:O-antigen/teichoic acid export membrane protein
VAVACLVLRTTSLDHVVHGQVTLAVGTGVTYAWFTLRPHSRRSDDGERTPLTTRVRLELVPILVAKKNCALYYAPSELLGSLTLNLPTLLIEHYFGLPLAGQFGVVLRFCGAPVTILSTTIGQVYHGALANAVRERAREAYGNFLRLRRALVGIGIFSGVGIFVVMPFVITLLLGARWRDAANIARGLSPMYAAMIAVGPLTASFQVFEAQRAILLLQIASAAISAISFVFAGILGRFWVGIGLYSALVAVRYLVLLSGISRMSRERLEPFASA